MAEQPELCLRPIGRVVEGPSCPPEEGWEGREALVEIDAAWAGALEGIEGFSHVWIVWWLDRSGSLPEDLRVHPDRREDLPRVGILATRSPVRPNPLAMTAVALLGREGRCLRVRGLDACQGTPVLDVKPYLRRGDLVPEATVPAWLEQLWAAHDDERPATPAAAEEPGRQVGGAL
ncbi:MAG: tRNA (N6-threonylcarbamoyladenosine(37)-N6)-methyltransferase TrmO [Chloroflexi bacterium]|nr:MAG: tRNA (N6-threonylcarbamoyladenosine(37)-N6)-methyltransferase TrmO [Chloroflexota bacterium]